MPPDGTRPTVPNVVVISEKLNLLEAFVTNPNNSQRDFEREKQGGQGGQTGQPGKQGEPTNR